MNELLARCRTWLTSVRSGRVPRDLAKADHWYDALLTRPRGELATWLLVLIAPAVVFAPILFRGYTLSQNVYAIDSAKRYGRVETIVQPDGQRIIVPTVRDTISGLQDEPWLVHIRRCLKEGWLPLIDRRSGAGTPLAELLQPGVFYPLNALLPLLPDGPLLFDLFSLLHVWVLLVGLFVLFRRLEAGLFAAPLAILLALSPLTFLHVNMVHYRGHVWFPWILVGLDGVLREQRIGRSALVLLLGSLFAVTAGNPQDALVSGGCALVFLVGTAWSQVDRPWRRLGLGGVLLGTGFGAGAVAIAPYAFAVKDGVLSQFGDAGRSELALPLANWIALLIPGSQSWRLLSGTAYDVLPELSPTFLLLMVLALLTATRRSVRCTRWPLVAVIAVVAVVWLLKLARPDWFPWIKHLPVLSALRATKYQSQLFLLMAAAMAVVLGRWSVLDVDRRHRLLLTAGGVVLVATYGAFAWAFLDSPVGHWPDRVADARLAHWTAMQVIVCSGVAGLSAILLGTSRSPRQAGLLLSVLMIAQGAATLPAGYPQRRATYATLNEINTLGPRVAEGRVATTWTTANTHLLFPDLACLGTLSPINARTAEEVLRGDLRHMEILGTWCLAHLTQEPLSAEELGLIQLLGVRFLAGHTLAPDAAATIPHLQSSPPSGLIELPDALPATAFLVPPGLYDRYSGDNRPSSWRTCWSDVSQTAVAPGPAFSIRDDGNSLQVTAIQPVDGGLVLNAFYSPYWTIHGERPVRFARHLPAWRIQLAAGETATIRYLPRGLPIGLGVSLVSIGLFVATTIIWSRRFARAQSPKVAIPVAPDTTPSRRRAAA